MNKYRFKAEHYTSQGTAQGTESNGKPQVLLRVLAYNTNAADTSESAPKHAQVVLLGEDGNVTTPLAFFTSEQAQKLATALHAAANAAGCDTPDC